MATTIEHTTDLVKWTNIVVERMRANLTAANIGKQQRILLMRQAMAQAKTARAKKGLANRIKCGLLVPDSRTLLHSLQGVVKTKISGKGIFDGATDISWIQFSMPLYGMFTDMGVSRTHKYKSGMATIKRSQQRFFSHQLYREIKILTYFLQKEAGHKLISELSSSMTNKIYNKRTS